MTNEEQQIIKAMILENKKDVVVIKKIREYTNLGVLQAKKVYEKIKRVYNYIITPKKSNENNPYYLTLR